VANVFVSSTQHGKLGVMVAQSGFQETAANGDRFLVLLNGRRYEGEPDPRLKIFEFGRYAMRIETAESAERAPTRKRRRPGICCGIRRHETSVSCRGAWPAAAR